MPYVSRGGVKLANALDTLGLDVEDRQALDVGASTGGFTDCLLQRGATHVIALDVAYGELDYRLREDERVTVIERANARAITPDQLPYRPDLVVIDVSFISLTLLVTPLAAVTRPSGRWVLLVKPQFEVGRERLEPGGVVRDPTLHAAAVRQVSEAAAQVGRPVQAVVPSRLPGQSGNQEFFALCARPDPAVP